MNLSFYESLSDDRKAYADKIAKQARAMNIPPELAVAIAYQESGLNPKVKPGGVGEIGIMQVRPSTAKELGYSIDDLKDPEKNIEAGLKYLKRSLDLSEGDPRLAAAGYNAGVNHPFFAKEDANLPDTTVKYLQSLKGFGAFTGAAPAEAAPVATTEGEYSEEALKAEEDINQERAETFGTLAGGTAGSAVTGARLAAPVVKKSAALANRIMTPAVRQAAEIIGGRGAPTPPTGMPPPAPPQGGLPPQGGQRIPFKATGPGSATANYARAFGLPEIEAGKALSMSKDPGGAWDLLNRRQQALGDIASKFPGERYVENPRFGGLMTPDQGAGAGPRQSFVSQQGGLQALPPRAPVSSAPIGPLEQVKGLFLKMMGPGSIGRTAVRYAAPPLAGMQIGHDISSLASEAQKREPDYTKMGLSGLGALGAAMSLFPMTAPIGIPIAVGAPLAQAYREKTEGALPVTTEVVAP